MPLIDTAKYILFDLDGTILDNYAWTYNSLKETLQAFGYPTLTTEIYDSIQGRGEPFGLRFLGVSDEHMDAVVNYRRNIMRATAQQVTLFDGMAALLTSLRQAGRQLGIVTGSSRAWVDIVPAARQAVSLVDLLVTMEDTRHPKPHPEPIYFALERLGGAPGQAFYIGDTPRDIESANRAGCQSVLAAWNGNRYDGEFGFKPDYKAASVGDLQRILIG